LTVDINENAREREEGDEKRKILLWWKRVS
jgi:hypothetical protein